MRAAWVGIAVLVMATGCQWGTRTPPREQTQPYDLVPQSGYLADGPTVSPEYAPGPSAEGEVEYDQAAYRETIRKDLVRINALLTENDRLRQELAVAQATLAHAHDEIENLLGKIAELEAALERAEARTARQPNAALDDE